jgi:hypothetical protein
MADLSPEDLSALKGHVKSLYPGMTDDNLKNINQEEMVQLVTHATQTGVSPQEEEAYGSTPAAIANEALQAITGDNLPAIAAGINAPFSDQSYEDLKKLYEEQIKKNIETHPIAAKGLGLPAGLFAGGELMKALGIGGKAVTKFGSPLFNRMLTGAKQGATTGAASGAIQNSGSPEAFYESPEAAMQKALQIGGGAAIGGVLGAGGGGLAAGFEKLGKNIFSTPFRKIDAQLHKENPELGKKQFSDLLWKYKTSGDYGDVQKAMELVAKEEKYPVIQEMKRRVDEGTLGIEGKDLVDMLKKAISPKTGEGIEAGSVSNWIDNQIEAHYIAKGIPEEAAKVAANREAIRQAKLHNEAIAQQELPFMDTAQKTVTTAVPLTAPEKAMPPIEPINFSMYPEQTNLQLKNLITGVEINPEIANRGAIGDAYKSMGMSIPEGPQKGLVMPVRSPYIVPEAERPIFGALQSEMTNANILPAEKRSLGEGVIKTIEFSPPGHQLEMGFPTIKQMPMEVPMPIPEKGEKVAFSDLSDFVRKLQGEATWNPISAGTTEKTKGGLFRNVATKAREVRNKMAKEVAPELYPKYEAVQKELGTIAAARNPLTSLVKAEESSPFLPYRDAVIGAGLANLVSNAGPGSIGSNKDWSYWDWLTGAGLVAGAMRSPRAGQRIGKIVSGIGSKVISPMSAPVSAKAAQSILQAIPEYLKPNEEPQP